MFAPPQAEHRWLDQLLGSWDFVHHCQMADGTSTSTLGKMTCRSLGGLWLICESRGQSEDADVWASIMTLGFDPKKNQYVGSFIASMMAQFWLYQGVLDESGTQLPLDTEGPKFDGSGIGKFRDTIVIVDADTWLFTGEQLTDDGRWIKFLDGKHRRSNDELASV